MATFGSTVRRGLPRVPGGEPWPPAGAAPGANGNGAAPAEAPVSAVQATQPAGSETSTPRVATPGRAAAVPEVGLVAQHAGTDAATPGVANPEAPAPAASRGIRRGLPRVAGGEPWPPASTLAASSPVVQAAQHAGTDAATPRVATPEQPAADQSQLQVAQHAGTDAAAPRVATPEAASSAGDGAKALRRGLPRVAGGEPWPPAGLAPTAIPAAVTDAAATVSAPTERAVRTGLPRPGAAAPAPVVAAAAEASVATAQTSADAETPVAEVVAPAAPATATGVPLSEPLPFRRTVWAGATAKTRPAVAPEPKRIGPFTRGQWAGAVIVGGAGLLYAAGMAVLAVRWLLSTTWGVDFLAAYPGEYHLPEGAPVGIPAWLGWQHFFNVFLMVLIIRSGLQVRTDKRPSVFWSPRNNGRRKMSLNLWFHQSLDILWIVNGVIFVALLFITGQWMKIVPTSWEVFPNAVSAALQYVSLDWPTENGWVNYNSLQQLAYFATVFLAAPLAIATGVRMSHVWPKNAAGLNRAYPVEWARAVHFPVMLYFVVFIAVHVFLVFATGALRNLNHMYAAQGSVDPDAYADNWTGFWFFVASLVVIAAAWVAARPLVLAPIARLFGKVSGR
ncbi:cytochrome b/b6 domain-containing protein [Microbacterium trichothecenolyticum]|uniref:cytochrome b/b6 domain-containing protein n=1 Tax=Microbacterium trichothecenolyticum TaxID=69370 RepID=UPI001C6EB4D0|nr:cytochrome b/b6 domain-containing protein [Microbacterium trichothecenolyticum]MBW9119709.1 cytochrome b/b6 domain-containing protein [Microbacterium trichothecenolyticum]